MTYDDDLAILTFEHGTLRPSVKSLGLSWPPPEKIEAFGIPMERVRMSQLTDEQRADMTHVLRAAEYKPIVTTDGTANK